MSYKETAIRIFEEMTVLLSLKGDNAFKIRAYEKAARSLQQTQGDLPELFATGQIDQIQGIGQKLKAKLEELISSGQIAEHQDLTAAFPGSVLEMLAIPNLGPKKARVLYEQLKITSIDELEEACKQDQLLSLKGFAKKTQENILKGISQVRINRNKFLLHQVLPSARQLLSDLRELPEVESADIAGSLRRWKETVKDMDLVVATRHPDKVMQAFIEHPLTQEVIVSGSTKTSVRLKHQINVDLRAVSPEQYPYALMHFTGSKEHNTEMRQRAKDRDLKLNEYGLFRGEELIPCANEQQIFEQLDLHYIPPELREATDEFEWAEKQNYPDLIATTDIKGLFHIHTTYSDGTATLEELAASARSLGLEYLGISDHSQSASYAGGLTADDVEEQHFEIDELNKLWNNFKLLKGIESDILPNGSLDYPDEILAQFDFVIASIHSYFKLSEEDMTRRVIIAIENPATTMLGHPTGRLLLHRLPYQINIYKVIDAAIANDVIIEINSNPYRLDLDWRVLDYARNNGLMVSINPDAHNLLGLGDFEYGVGIARKAALCPKHVFNTRDLSAVQKYLAKKSK